MKERRFLKQATCADMATIIDLKMKMFTEVGALPYLRADVRDEIARVYVDLYKRKWACHFFFVEGGKYIACAGGVLKDDVPHCFFKKPVYGFVVDVYTEPEYRGQGLATCLMEAVISWFKEKEVKAIKLFPAQMGKGIYRKFGFEETTEMILRL